MFCRLLKLRVNGAGFGIRDCPVTVVFQFRLALSHLVGDAPGVGEDVALVQRQKRVELGDPIRHVHGHAPHGLAFGENQILFHEIVQRRQFRFGEVIFGDDHILFADH